MAQRPRESAFWVVPSCKLAYTLFSSARGNKGYLNGFCICSGALQLLSFPCLGTVGAEVFLVTAGLFCLRGYYEGI